MYQYAFKRVLLAIPTFLGITLITFAVLHLAPGDPAAMRVDGTGDPSASVRSYELLRAYMGLDQPVHVRYLRWLGRLFTLDFGTSFADGTSVYDKIMARLPWTLALALAALFLGLIVSIPIGLYSAARKGRVFDSIVGAAIYGLYSVPNYVMAMLLILIVAALDINWLSFRGARSDGFESMSLAGNLADLAKHFVLILICYTYASVAFQARFIRTNVLSVLQSDYIRTARAKGVGERAVYTRHAWRNTLIPLITFLGLAFPTMVSGSVILEVQFSWPGMGRLLFESISRRDYPTIMALTVLSSVLVLVSTLIADLAYAWVDPRLRQEGVHE